MLQRIIKIILWIIWFFVATISGFLIGFLHLSKSVNMIATIILFVGCFLSFLVLEIIWTTYANSKFQKLQPILFQENGDIHYYISEVTKLMNNSSNPAILACCGINISCAYSILGDYRSAKESLYNVKYKKLKEPLFTNYWISFAGAHFESGDYDTGLKICEEHAQQFNQYKEHPSLGGSIAILELYQSLAHNNTEHINERFEQLISKWNNEIYSHDFRTLKKHINNRT